MPNRFAFIPYVLSLVIASFGCKPAVVSQKPQPEVIDPAAQARDLLDEVNRQYRSATSYSDNGYVRLAYQRGGVDYDDRAPLAVQFQKPNKVKMEAYALRLASDGRTMDGFISDDETNNFDGQFLVSPVSDILTLDEVYADPVVAQFAGAGMAGPPPQLELLLADTPLNAWLQDPAKLSIGEDASIDGHRCQRVIVEAEDLQYRLWIDSDEKLVRRIELPWQAIVAGISNDPSIQSASLTIEFADARFDVPSRVASFKMPRPPLSRAVSTLVVPPPPAPHEMLGRRPSSFTLVDSAERFEITAAGSGRDANVLMWIANHPASRQGAEVLQQTIQSLPAEVQAKTRVILINAEPQEGFDTGEMLRSWQIGLPWTDDPGAVGRDVFAITEAPCLVVLGAEGKVELFHSRLTESICQSLPRVIADVAARNPVGKALADQYVADCARYLRSIATNDSFAVPLAESAPLFIAKEKKELSLR